MGADHNAGESLKSRVFAWIKQYRIWLLIALGFLAFFAKGAPSPGKLERDKNAWSEYFVYALAAERMSAGERVHVLPHDRASVISEQQAQAKLDLDVPLHERFLQKLRGHVYSYPPLLATLAVPFAKLGNYRIASILWYLAIYAASVASLWLIWRMGMGKPDADDPSGYSAITMCQLTQPRKTLWPTGLDQSEREELLSKDAGTRCFFFVIFLIVGLAPFMGPISNQQTDAWIMLSALAGVALLSRGTSGLPYFAAAMLIGLAAGAKGPVLILALWLLWKHRFMGAWRVLFFAIIANGAADLFFPAFDSAGERIYYLRDWVHRVALPNVASGEAAATTEGIWNTFNHQNQALGATLTRIFTAGERPDHIMPALIQLGDGARKALTYAVLGITLALSLWATRGTPWRKDRNLFDKVWGRASLCKREGENKERGHLGILREVSVFLLLALLFSPMTSPAHLIMALPALLIVMRDGWITRDRVLKASALFAMLVLMLINKSLLNLIAKPLQMLGEGVPDGSEMVNILRFYGVQTWVMVALLIGAARACWLASRAGDADAAGEYAEGDQSDSHEGAKDETA